MNAHAITIIEPQYAAYTTSPREYPSRHKTIRVMDPFSRVSYFSFLTRKKTEFDVVNRSRTRYTKIIEQPRLLGLYSEAAYDDNYA